MYMYMFHFCVCMCMYVYICVCAGCGVMTRPLCIVWCGRDEPPIIVRENYMDLMPATS